MALDLVVPVTGLQVFLQDGHYSSHKDSDFDHKDRPSSASEEGEYEGAKTVEG
jgi:hypothetical protein